MGNIEFPAIACADDLGLNANTEGEAQVMAAISDDFVNKQRYEIQADKSATIEPTVGKVSDNAQTTITMGGSEIPTVKPQRIWEFRDQVQ